MAINPSVIPLGTTTGWDSTINNPDSEQRPEDTTRRSSEWQDPVKDTDAVMAKFWAWRWDRT